ncbi:hypothetical protein ACTHQ4_15375 [Alkalicoccobacillus gibsonii]|uniref:hypothetical protein n=1 Tax=Alkalicoccobacillus gibsonii TaxID=79881 RepID=UPI003F7B8197
MRKMLTEPEDFEDVKEKINLMFNEWLRWIAIIYGVGSYVFFLSTLFLKGMDSLIIYFFSALSALFIIPYIPNKKVRRVYIILTIPAFLTVVIISFVTFIQFLSSFQ